MDHLLTKKEMACFKKYIKNMEFSEANQEFGRKFKDALLDGKYYNYKTGRKQKLYRDPKTQRLYFIHNGKKEFSVDFDDMIGLALLSKQ